MFSLRFALVALLSVAPQVRSEESPLNIIYLMLDEWGYFESGHMGHSEQLTPNIDQFAAEGMRFTNAYTGAPVCELRRHETRQLKVD